MEKNIERVRCHECAVLEGQYHAPGCDAEICPFCGEQLNFGCQCDPKPGPGQRIPFIDYPIPCVKCGGLPWERIPDDELREISHRSRSRAEFEEQLIKATKKSTWRMVADKEWRTYVEPNRRRSIICPSCYRQIKEWIEQEGTRMDPEIRSYRDPEKGPLMNG